MGRGPRTFGGSRKRDQCNYGIQPIEICDSAVCCSVTPCCLCVTYTDGNGEVTNAEACGPDGFYETAIHGAVIMLYWFRNQYTDECEFIVEYAGEEIARLLKCDEQYCVEPEGQATLDNGDVIGWSTYLKPRRTARSINQPCEDPPCIECRCLCERLCILWRRDTGFGTDLQCTGYGCDNDCDSVLIEAELDQDCFDGGVVWGPVIFEPDCDEPISTVSVYVELRVEGGYCQLVLVVDGEDRAATILTDETASDHCKNVSLSATWEDDEGCIVTVTVECKKCGDPCFSSGASCKKGCCFTDILCLGLGNHIDSIPFDLTGPFGTVRGSFVQDIFGDTGACGRCGCLTSNTTYPIQGQYCDSSSGLTPCSNQFFFSLDCETGYQGDAPGDIDSSGEETIAECGNRMRLLIGTTRAEYTPASEFDNSTTPYGCFLNPSVSSLFASLPITVECGPGGITGVIDLSSVSVKDCEPVYDSPCEGTSSVDCCELSSGFEGMTITLLPFAEL